jgi:GGDEF domain-containing protein
VTDLGWLPVADPAHDARLVAHVGVLIALILGLILLADLGFLRQPAQRRRILAGMGVLSVLVFGVIWLLTPGQAAAYGTLAPLAGSVAALPVVIVSARRGDRIAWLGVFAVTALVVALAGSLWIVLDRQGAPWQVHAVSALAGIAYLSGIGGMLWLRYSYLIELRGVLAQGPRYDPITRMQADAASGRTVAEAFHRQHHPGRPVVLAAVSIGNLYALENLHGRAALNHALFVTAGRLRRCVPPDIAIERLYDDAFLLVSGNARDLEGLVTLGRVLATRLSKPVNLRTGGDDDPERQTAWVAQIGVGLLATTAQANPAAVVARVRDMSRTAWSYASRVAWHDQGSDAIAELPALETA